MTRWENKHYERYKVYQMTKQYLLFTYIIGVLPQSVRPYVFYTLQKLYLFYSYASTKKISIRNNRNPTKQMLDSRDYFDANMKRVNNVASYLFDDTSRTCYYRMIDFRCNNDWTNFPLISKDAYFYNEFFLYDDNEIFVDCGAFNGDTVMKFKRAMKKQKGDYSRIVAFEPDEKLFNMLTKSYPEVTAIKAGVWSRDDIITIDNGVLSIPVKNIDNCHECEGVTLLKMDIEGAEIEALKGAIKTIAKYKPKLAICIYHSDEDMIKIPEWIHDNFPDYKLFVRQHHKYVISETVLYGFI